MNNKINISMERNEITDEELERFKNFDSLLARHQQSQLTKKSYWKFIVPAVLLLSAGLYTLIPLRQEDSANKPEVVDRQLGQVNKEDTTPLVVDSASQKEQSTGALKKPSQQKARTAPSENERAPDKAESAEASKESAYIQAEPVDGYQALYEYFGNELVYPEAGVKDSIQGVLTVSFVINREGLPEQIKTSGPLGPSFEQEAIRLVKGMPAWKPATLNGHPVPSRLSLPLTFQLLKK